MARTAFTSSQINPKLAQADKVIDLAVTPLPVATVQLYGDATDDADPGAVWTWAWTVLRKPAGSAASFINATVQNPILQNVDVYGNYLILLVATNTNSGLTTETNPLKAPNTARTVVRLKGATKGLQKPAPGERDWIALYHEAVAALEALVGTAPASAPFLTDGPDGGLTAERNIQALAAALPFVLKDGGTNTEAAALIVKHLLTVGVAAAGLGVKVPFAVQDDTGTERTAAEIAAVLTNATPGTLAGDLILRSLSATTHGIVESLRIINAATIKLGAELVQIRQQTAGKNLEIKVDDGDFTITGPAGAWKVNKTTGHLEPVGGARKITGLDTPTDASDGATKGYVDAAVTGLLDLKGDTDCSGNPNYPAASKGDAYYVTVAGKIGGAAGKAVEVGDVYVAKTDNAGGDEAAVGASWFVLEHNLVGALLASQLDTDGTLAANSDNKIATQKATKTYVDALVPGAGAAPKDAPYLTKGPNGTLTGEIDIEGLAAALGFNRTDGAGNSALEVMGIGNIPAGAAAAGLAAALAWYLKDSAGNRDLFGALSVVADDVTDGSEDGSFSFTALVAGTLAGLADLSKDGLTIKGPGTLDQFLGKSSAGTLRVGHKNPGDRFVLVSGNVDRWEVDSATGDLKSSSGFKHVYGQAYDTRTITSGDSPYTPASTDDTILIDASGGNVNVTLGAVAGLADRRLRFKRIDNSANTATLTPNGAETIDGAASYSLNVQYEAATLQCDGAAWYVF